MVKVLKSPRTRPLREARNTFALPRGESIRRELARWFRRQRTAVLDWLRTGTKDQGPPAPGVFPDWEEFRLGALAMSERITPLIELLWDEAGGAFTSRIGLDPNSWDVTNPHTQAMIQAASLDLCQETLDTTSLSVQDALDATRKALTAGLVTEGESIAQLTKRIKTIFDGAETWRARRIATSEASRAVHAAQEQAAIASHVVTGWRWLLSQDACPKCQVVARKVNAVRLGQAFAVVGNNPTYSTVRHPPLHPHCCLPETPIVAPGRISGIEAQYDGPVVRLVFSDGTDVTITPNHMLLTPTGFAPASALMKGDEVIRYRGTDGITGVGPDDDWQPAPIQEVVSAFAKSGCMATGSVPVAPKYLHGDAAFCQGDIDVVTSNRLLWDRFEPHSGEPFLDGTLCRPHIGCTHLVRQSYLATVLLALRDATDGGMGSIRERQAIGWAQLRHPVELTLGAIAGFDSRFGQSQSNGMAGDSQTQSDSLLRLAGLIATDDLGGVQGDTLGHAIGRDFDSGLQEPMPESIARHTDRLRETLHAFPSLIATCQVVNVERLHYVGPIYDVQTTTSLYLLGNGIASSNCQCSLIEVLDTDEQPLVWGTTLIQPVPETVDYAPGEAPANAPKPKPKPKVVKPKPAVKPRTPKPSKPTPKPASEPKPVAEPVVIPAPAVPPPSVPKPVSIPPPKPIGPALHPNPEIDRALRIAAEHGVPARVIDDRAAAIKIWRIGVREAPGGYYPASNEIIINPHADAWTDPEWLRKSKETGWFSTGHPDAIIRHEIGHYRHRNNMDLKEFEALRTTKIPAKLKRRIKTEISEYATRNPQEFVGETYSKLTNGEPVAADLLEYFDKLGGVRP